MNNADWNAMNRGDGMWYCHKLETTVGPQGSGARLLPRDHPLDCPGPHDRVKQA